MTRVCSMTEDETVLLEQPDIEKLASSTRWLPGQTEQQTTAGAMLRDARQAQGMDIAALAASLKVPVQKLYALEQDQFDQLLDPVFARALASSMCRILKSDPVPVLQRLPAIAAFKVTSQNRGINQSFRARDGSHGASVWTRISRPAILVGLALLLGAVLLIFLPLIQQEIARYKLQTEDIGSKSVLVNPVSTSLPATTEILAPSGPAAVLPIPPGLPQLSAEARTVISTPAAAPISPVSATAADVNANATITFSAIGDSWIRVTDAKGLVVLGRTLRTGESAGASGVLPLAAVVGRADAIQVQVRGQAFSLGGVTKNNVARFEVK
jgi:cytoskeleton protein RodZ